MGQALLDKTSLTYCTDLVSLEDEGIVGVLYTGSRYVCPTAGGSLGY